MRRITRLSAAVMLLTTGWAAAEDSRPVRTAQFVPPAPAPSETGPRRVVPDERPILRVPGDDDILPLPDLGEPLLAPPPQPFVPEGRPLDPASPRASPPVVLYPHVRIDDRDEIDPRARPVIVPVRDPRRGSPPDAVVYIQLYLSPRAHHRYFELMKRGLRSKIELEVDDYEVEIHSRNGVVSIEYDD